MKYTVVDHSLTELEESINNMVDDGWEIVHVFEPQEYPGCLKKYSRIIWEKNKDMDNPNEKVTWTNNDIDVAYVMGCMNTGGVDVLSEELKRLKELGLKPYQILKEVLKK